MSEIGQLQVETGHQTFKILTATCKNRIIAWHDCDIVRDK